jgi:hydrogenase maturation protease
MKIAVVCLGNELVGDDGIGIRVGRVLKKLPLPPSVDVLIRPNLGLDLIEMLEEYDEVVIVDAMTSGRPPGACIRLDPREAESMASCPSCSHSLGIAEILQLVRRMFPQRAERAVRIVGVEAASIDQFGVGLSDPVKLALPSAVHMVLDAIGTLEALRTESKRLAEEEARTVVSVDQVLRSGTLD